MSPQRHSYMPLGSFHATRNGPTRVDHGPVEFAVHPPQERPFWVTFAALRDFEKSLDQGYTPGRNVAVQYRFSDGDDSRLPAIAAEFVRRQVAVIVAIGGLPAVAVTSATSTIPIVFSSGADPVGQGLVESLSRPGGNATGVALFTNELGPKRLELLRELA